MVAAEYIRISKEGRFGVVINCYNESKSSFYVHLWFARILGLDRVGSRFQTAPTRPEHKTKAA